MKKITLFLVAVSISQFAKAQVWDINLNALAPSDSANIGTSSPHGINFYTNNSQKMSLGTNGVLKLNTLSGIGNRFLQSDASGNLIPWSGSIMNKDYQLFGDGNWRLGPVLVDANNSLHTAPNTKLGIGNANPIAELDVTGKGAFSSDLQVGGIINIANDYKIERIAPTNSSPLILRFSPNTTPGTGPLFSNHNYKGPCNVWYNDPTHLDPNGLPYSTPWTPPTANVYNDLLQIYESNQQNSVLSLGILNGDGIIGLEPFPGNSVSQKLKLNPGCSNDVYICEGGGYTKIAGNAGVGGFLEVSGGQKIGTGLPSATATELDISLAPWALDALVITNPALPAPNNKIFEVSNSGKTFIGENLLVNGSQKLGTGAQNSAATQLDISVSAGMLNGLSITNPNLLSQSNKIFEISDIGKTFVGENLLVNGSQIIGANVLQNNGSALTVGQANHNDIALSLTDNSSSPNKDFFNVYGNGYTEIKVYNPSAMPLGGNGSFLPRVFTITDMAASPSRELFAITKDGKVYAREVEISLANNFPDYVFDKDYKLNSLENVEKYIHENKHLPGFEKGEYYETNGINVNTMIVKQQEKIEELTLYIIELEKRLKAVEQSK